MTSNVCRGGCGSAGPRRLLQPWVPFLFDVGWPWGPGSWPVGWGSQSIVSVMWFRIGAGTRALGRMGTGVLLGHLGVSCRRAGVRLGATRRQGSRCGLQEACAGLYTDYCASTPTMYCTSLYMIRFEQIVT